MDVLTKSQRSALMASIRSYGNRTTEGRLVALFRAAGVKGWRRHCPLPGKPDFVFRVVRVAIFVDGCFWHGCPRCYKMPKSNRVFWAKRIRTNMTRDRRVATELRRQGWRVLRVWECRLRQPERTLRRILRSLAE